MNVVGLDDWWGIEAHPLRITNANLITPLLVPAQLEMINARYLA
ncbi:hypothetical protein [Nocardiopsis sp. CNT312]|nr:hypothetical protein [Nocardiopsis sp. CNT312]